MFQKVKFNVSVNKLELKTLVLFLRGLTLKSKKKTKDNQFPITVHAEQITNLFLNIGEPHRINKTSTKAKTGGKIAQGTREKREKNCPLRNVLFISTRWKGADGLINQKFYGQESLNGK